MTQPALTRAQSRCYDQLAIETFGVPSLVLMENAARNCVDVMQDVGIRGPVVIVCGKGNNAGDGFAIARLLAIRGVDVRVATTGEPHEYTPDTLVNWTVLERAGVRACAWPELTSLLNDAEWAVDALLGTGARGKPRPPLDQVIATLNQADVTRLAIDVPSGFDCDTGVAGEPAFRADHTCTFVALKRGMLATDAARHCGQIHVVDVCAPAIVLEQLLKSEQTSG